MLEPDSDSCSVHQADIVIVGGGVIGIATAYNLLLLHPALDVILLDSGDLGANTGRYIMFGPSTLLVTPTLHALCNP